VETAIKKKILFLIRSKTCGQKKDYLKNTKRNGKRQLRNMRMKQKMSRVKVVLKYK
jgi:hypothetical protein